MRFKRVFFEIESDLAFLTHQKKLLEMQRNSEKSNIHRQLIKQNRWARLANAGVRCCTLKPSIMKYNVIEWRLGARLVFIYNSTKSRRAL